MKRRLLAVLMSVAGLLGPAAAALAQTCSKHSPAHTVALLELYTSEGCSSCPPADRYLSGLRDPAALAGLGPDQLVPLALHVDYWNDIGWKDRFSSPQFTARQRWLSQLAASRTVYTPEVFVDGRELRNWHGDTVSAIKRINARPAGAVIDIALGAVAAGGVPLTVKAQSEQSGQLFVALYENALSTDVRAGENSGAQLHHDYVVRELLGPFALKGGTAELTRALKLPLASITKNLGVAAFVQSDQGQLLQTLALPVCM